MKVFISIALVAFLLCAALAADQMDNLRGSNEAASPSGDTDHLPPKHAGLGHEQVRKLLFKQEK